MWPCFKGWLFKWAWGRGCRRCDSQSRLEVSLMYIFSHVCFRFFQENPGISMTNKFGQKYFCTLPKSLQDDNDDDGGDAGDKKSSVKLVHGPDNIPELLAPMAKEPCLMKTKDWWTYEVCYKKIAKQYHLEGSKCHNFFLVASIGKLFLQNYSSTMKAKLLSKEAFTIL